MRAATLQWLLHIGLEKSKPFPDGDAGDVGVLARLEWGLASLLRFELQ